MTVTNFGNSGNQPKYLVIIDEKTGEEVGRCTGLNWQSVVDLDGDPVGYAQFSYDKGTRDKEIRGPVKKIGFVSDWAGTADLKSVEAVRSMAESLAASNNNNAELALQNSKLLDRLIAVLRMVGGATTISVTEMGEAIQYGIEESWNPTSGTSLILVEKA